MKEGLQLKCNSIVEQGEINLTKFPGNKKKLFFANHGDVKAVPPIAFIGAGCLGRKGRLKKDFVVELFEGGAGPFPDAVPIPIVDDGDE